MNGQGGTNIPDVKSMHSWVLSYREERAHECTGKGLEVFEAKVPWCVLP